MDHFTTPNDTMSSPTSPTTPKPTTATTNTININSNNNTSISSDDLENTSAFHLQDLSKDVELSDDDHLSDEDEPSLHHHHHHSGGSNQNHYHSGDEIEDDHRSKNKLNIQTNNINNTNNGNNINTNNNNNNNNQNNNNINSNNQNITPRKIRSGTNSPPISSSISNISLNSSSSSINNGMIGNNGNDIPFSRLFIICGKEVTENHLQNAFKRFGTIESVKIVFDKETRESKGLAYIKYQKASSAALAIETMNGTLLDLNKSDNDNDDENSTIDNQTSTTTTSTNTNTTEKNGTTTTAPSIPTNSSVPLKVMIAEAKGQKTKTPPSTDPEDNPPNSRLFIVCKKDVTEADLTNRFKDFGNLEHVKIVREHDTNESKGCAFVKFTKSSTAALAMESINESDDKSAKAIFAQPKVKHHKQTPETIQLTQFPMVPPNPYPFQGDFTNPYAVGFPTISRQRLFVVCHKSVTQDSLYKLFSKYPGMEYCDLKKDKVTNKSKGFAYVNYSTPQAALMAKNSLNGIKYPPGGFALKVVFAEPLGIKSTNTNIPQTVVDPISSIQTSFAQMPLFRRNSNNETRKRQKI